MTKTDQVFNKIQYKERRQKLRTDMTEPEIVLWQVLRNQQLGVKFRRQHGIAHYIVDFYCAELNLIIEIDGTSHLSADAKEYDKERDDFMLALSIKTIRIQNDDVINNIQTVLEFIKSQLEVKRL